MRHADFSLYTKKEKDGLMWYAKFWDFEAKRFTVYRSLKIEAGGKSKRRLKAYTAAEVMLQEVARADKCQESFIDFLSHFWAKGGIYDRVFMLQNKKKLSASYLRLNNGVIKNHISVYPKFKNLPPDKITGGIIQDYMLWATAKGTSDILINKTLQNMRVAMRYLYDRDEITQYPFQKIKDIPVASCEKGVFNKQEIVNLLTSDVIENTAKSGIMLGMLCGMRLGEIQGLKWEDIEGDIINIRNNWQRGEGIKEPKCGSARQVFLPPELKAMLAFLEKKTAFVFPGIRKCNNAKPASGGYFRNIFAKALESIGIDETQREARHITFHSLRHSFITNGRVAGISDIEICALAGHKSAAMMERYSHAKQVLDLEKLKTTLTGYYSGDVAEGTKKATFFEKTSFFSEKHLTKEKTISYTSRS
jgi:integrase